MSEMSTANPSKVIQITDVEEYDEFKKNKRGIIFYGAEWCDACQLIKDIYARIANRYHKRIAMAYCDINVCGLDFSRIPVFVAMHQGKQINSLEGANDDSLKMLIRETIDYDPDLIPKQPEPDDSPGPLDTVPAEVNPAASEPNQTENNKPQAVVMILTEEPKGLKKIITPIDQPKLLAPMEVLKSPAPVEESKPTTPVIAPEGGPSTSNVSASLPKGENKLAPKFVMFEEIGLRPKKGAKK